MQNLHLCQNFNSIIRFINTDQEVDFIHQPQVKKLTYNESDYYINLFVAASQISQ